jgi:hypothetical protein
MIHNPCIIRIGARIGTTNACKYVGMSLYTLSAVTCFGKLCGLFQGYEIQVPLYFTSLKMTTCCAEICRRSFCV